MTSHAPAARATALSSIVRVLYTQNPFYLIGTFLVLFGLQQSLGSESQLATSGLLVGMLASYTLLLAGVGTIIIRYGKVWDDARTILLVILLLFFMLSTSLDVHILYDPLVGTVMLAGGLLFSVTLSEGLLRGLRIRLASQYRGPYYLMLTLLFGYPVALAWLSRWGHYGELSWALFAFPAVAALALLTLLPAARTRRSQEPASGTPWPWPYYPWSLFIYLTIGVTIRAWWLTIAFQPTEGQDTGFRLYYLAPLVLAWSALLVEIGRARASRTALAVGMGLPLVTLAAAFPGPPTNPVEATFLAQLAEAIGSPAQLTVWSLLAFYGWTWLRNVRSAEACLIALALLAAIVGPQTLDVTTFGSPQPQVLAAIVVGLLVQAIRRESSWRAVLAGGLVAMGVTWDNPVPTSEHLWFWKWHAPVLGLFWVTALFNDDLARHSRELAWRASPVLAVIVALVYPWTMPSVSANSLTGFAALLLLTSIALWYRQKTLGPLGAVVLTLAANCAAHARQLYLALEQTLLANGLPWIATGLVLVALAFAISLLKMGLWQRGVGWLSRVNMALGGAS